ncbi:MAG TPA: hypothetical protein VN672_05595 [Solirubrobacteraceae bacterium]|nr:hypothetical protein [Solirubrobacteraceae bacterium]
MELLAVLLACVLVAVVLAIVGAPLRAARDREMAGEDVDSDTDPEHQAAYVRAELEAAREAKYLEIRDAELDLRTGKLSRADYEAVDGVLRAEALELLNRLQALDSGEGAEGGGDRGEGAGGAAMPGRPQPARERLSNPEVED